MIIKHVAVLTALALVCTLALPAAAASTAPQALPSHPLAWLLDLLPLPIAGDQATPEAATACQEGEGQSSIDPDGLTTAPTAPTAATSTSSQGGRGNPASIPTARRFC